MPKTKRYAKKRTYRRKKNRSSRNRANYSVARSTPISDRYFCKLNYTSLHSITYTGVGSAASYQFRLNSLFDPDYTGAGHQPMGFDQLAALYQRYRVYGCKWRVVFASQDTSQHVEVAVQSRPNPTISTNMQDILEKQYITKAVLGVEGSGQGVRTLSGYTSISKIRGVPKSVVKNESDYGALISANPVFQPCLNIFVQNMNTAASVVCNFRIHLTFFAEFGDKVMLTGS